MPILPRLKRMKLYSQNPVEQVEGSQYDSSPRYKQIIYNEEGMEEVIWGRDPLGMKRDLKYNKLYHYCDSGHTIR
jgi:hypothetical protein